MSESFNVSSTTASITVSWNKQYAEDVAEEKIDSYDIKYKDSESTRFNTEHASKDDTSKEIDGLKPSTSYQVNVYVCYESGDTKRLFGQKCKTQTSKTNFLTEKAEADKAQEPTFYYLQPVFTHELPLQNHTNKDEGVSAVDRIRICEMIARRNEGTRTHEEKTLLLLGATGTGKSTLIDAMMNYIAGVSYNDDRRFFLINKTLEEKQRADKQFESQTSSVTVYRIPKMEGLRVTCGVNIIDTPGYNDTRENFDKRITDQIKELFDKKIEHLDAILIVVPLSTTRLTNAQQHVFSSILKMFGDDIKDNIFLATTWDDSGEMTCLDVLKKAKVPYADIFRFNNANLYSAFSSTNDQSIIKEFWKERTNSFSRLFKTLEVTQKTTVTSSKEVMKARHNLEIQLVALEDKLTKKAQDIVNYKEDKTVLDAIEKETPENKEKLMYNRKVSVMKLQWSDKTCLNCNKCNQTCHKNCWVIHSKFKWTCEAMKKYKCTVCHGCDASTHEFKKAAYEVQFVDQMFSGADVVNRQKKREISFGELKQILKKIKELIEEINNKALQKDALTIEQYISNLVKKEEKEQKPGFEMRTQTQKKISEHLKTDGSIFNLSMDYLL